MRNGRGRAGGRLSQQHQRPQQHASCPAPCPPHRFSKFLQENDSKRARAEKKASDEIKARLQKEKEIEQLSDVLEELRAEKERVHGVLEKNMRCRGAGGDGAGGGVGGAAQGHGGGCAHGRRLTVPGTLAPHPQVPALLGVGAGGR